MLVTLGAQAEGGPARPTVAEQGVQRTCDAALEVTHALPPHLLARAAARPTPTTHMGCGCSHPVPRDGRLGISSARQ